MLISAFGLRREHRALASSYPQTIGQTSVDIIEELKALSLDGAEENGHAEEVSHFSTSRSGIFENVSPGQKRRPRLSVSAEAVAVSGAEVTASAKGRCI